MPFWNREKLIVFAGLLVAIVLVDPRGNFPLNDDWSYARNVANWLDGRFKLDDWAAMTQITHIAWGTLVSLLSGFSHENLRYASLCVVALTVLLVQHRLPPLTVPAIVFNPVFFPLSFTFMTDITFSLMFWASATCLLSGKIIAGTMTGSLAVLTRQTGVGLGPAWLMSSFWQAYKTHGRFSWRYPAIVSILLLLTLIIYTIVFEKLGLLSENFHGAGKLSWILHHDRPLARVSANVIQLVSYLGLFTLPFAPAAWNALPRKSSRWIVPFLTLLIFVTTLSRTPMKYQGNLITAMGIGPAVLPGGVSYGVEIPYFGLILTLGGAVGASLLLLQSVRVLTSESAKSSEVFSVILISGYLLFLSIGQFIFDRYLLPSIPFAVIVMRYQSTDANRSLQLGILCILAVYSIWGTQRWLDWNRDRFSVFQHAISRGIPASDINGGFEINGWYNNLDTAASKFWIRSRAYPEGEVLTKSANGLVLQRRPDALINRDTL